MLTFKNSFFYFEKVQLKLSRSLHFRVLRGRWHGLSFFYMLKVKTTAKIYDKINTCMSRDFVSYW